MTTPAGSLAARMRRDLAAKPTWLHRVGDIVQPDGSLRISVTSTRWTTDRWEQFERDVDRLAARYRTTVVAVDYAGDVLYRRAWA